MPPRSLASVNYANDIVPPDYKCDICGAHGVKLWREYNTMSDYTKLLCTEHAMEDQKNSFDPKENQNYLRSGQIGWLIAAVPTEGMDTYWGYTSIPQAGCDWWDRLPPRGEQT